MPEMENEYSSYLDMDSRPMSRYLRSDRERDEDAPLLRKMMVGTGIAAGALAVAYRTGGMRKLAGAIEVYGKGIAQAAKETMDQESGGHLFRLFGHAVSAPAGRRLFNKEFVERAKRSIEQRKRAVAQFGANREYDMQRLIRQLNRMVDKKVPYHIEEGIRFNLVIDELRKSHHFSEEQVNQVARAFLKANQESKGSFSLKYTHDREIIFHLNNAGIADKDTVEKILAARKKHRIIQDEKALQDMKERISRMQERLTRQAYNEMQEMTRKDGFLKRAIRGHRQATVQDVLDMHHAGRIKLDEETYKSLNRIIRQNQKFGDAIFDEQLYVKTRNGKAHDLIDYKIFNEMKWKMVDYWATSLPGGLLHLRDFLNIREARLKSPFDIIGRGSIQPGLNAQMGIANNEMLKSEVVYVNGRFYNLFDGGTRDTPLEPLNKGRRMYGISSQFGTIGKIMQHTSGIVTGVKENQNWFARTFDLGNQSKESGFRSVLSGITKFGNPEWGRNLIYDALNHGVDYDDFFKIKNYFERYTKGFSPRVLNNITDHLPTHLRRFIQDNEINFSREEDMLKLFEYLANPDMMVNINGVMQKNIAANGASEDLKRLWRQYERDKYEFMAKKQPVGEASLLGFGEYTNIQTSMDQVRQQMGLEILRQISEANMMHGSTPVSFKGILKDLREAGKISLEDMRQAEDLYAHYQFMSSGRHIYSSTDIALAQINGLFRGTSERSREFQEQIQRMVRKTNPIFQRFSGIRPVNQVGDDLIYVNEAFENGFFQQFTSFRGVADLFRQAFAGRRNMEDFTTLTAYNMYIPFRLQDALGNVGLGFSDRSMGNAAQIWSSLLLKRFLPAVAIPTYAEYIDDKTDQYFGTSISERWEIYKATRELRLAAERDPSDIYGILTNAKTSDELKREMSLRPGIEHFGAGPELYLPGIGKVGVLRTIGKLLGGGAPVDEKDTYTVEELQDYYAYGVDEVRQGRWWLFGSKSAYRGDRIIEFRPNSYRLALSDWEYTSVTSTMQERWEHTLFPTFENWFGLKNLIRSREDLYWWEIKHYYDRPYLLTGSMFNPNTPFIGDIGNATIGQIFKPIRQMHPEYWGDPVLMQEQADQYGARPTEPIMTKISPAGRMEHVVPATVQDYGSSIFPTIPVTGDPYAVTQIRSLAQSAGMRMPQYFVTRNLSTDGYYTGDFVLQKTRSGQAVYVPADIGAAGFTPEQLFEMGAPASPYIETKPRGLMEQEYPYRSEFKYQKLLNLQDPRDLNYQAKQFFDNVRETLGIYNWIGEELTGSKPENRMIIQKADYANNLSNTFWESNLGSLGGDFSEIMRRFLRRDDGKQEQYNPIRNTMPDWLPGGNYFINFQVGDPYSKIPHGEYRLPGEAYERLNYLHPDETGRYGAFDKFKILADVAPWSEEYKFWKEYVEENITDPELRKQIAVIKDQVARRKRKYEFTPYRFADAEIEKQKVTVTKFLDDYTFLTKEFGDTPIRLAGMQYQANAEGVLQSYISVGDRITIGIDPNPARRISDDTYGTIRAVVYRNNTNINRDILERGLMKENKNDFSAVGVHARYTPSEIRSGARWERLAHADTPFNTKFLPVRTALEEYERDQIYGKDWATWEGFLMKDYGIPIYHSAIKDNPIMAGAQIAGWATVLAYLFLPRGKSGRHHWYWGLAGFAAGAGGSLWRMGYEASTGEAWIPERRRIEHDINEYFDILKYMKYTGLYERAKEELLQQGIDIEAIETERELKEQMTKERRKELEAERRRLFIEQPAGWEERRREINQELKIISQNKDELFLPEAVLQALSYKEKAETTLYAVDPFGDRMKVMQAMPHKDRWFFNEFANAEDYEKERILELVAPNQRRIYKALWGGELEPQIPLEEYFKNRYLPGPDWIGWRPEVNLDDIMVKAVQEYDLDLNDFNFWDEDVAAGQLAPDLNEEGNGIYGFSGYKDMRKNIREILEGKGLRDVSVTVTPSSSQGARIVMNYQEDRSREIDNYLRYNMEYLM